MSERRWRRCIAVTLVAIGACNPSTSERPGTDAGSEDSAAPSVADASPDDGGSPPMPPSSVERGSTYFDNQEQFNRYYTDSEWFPTEEIYVSPTGGGSGDAEETPTSVEAGLAAAGPGTRVVFLAGTYDDVCYEIEGPAGGTYEQPLVLYAERDSDGSLAVRLTCCGTGRETCLNFEAANHIAVDGFILEGGKYGVRSVGSDGSASDHARGIAVLHSEIRDQSADGILTGASDWAVFEDNIVSGSGDEDGHGIYVSNGSDFNVVRFNDLYGNEGATFQVNADPFFYCEAPYSSEACSGIAGEGEGGMGASDYFLIEGNYFHHGLAQGSNFTSMRYSIVRNNVFAAWDRHGVSFWSETADPDDSDTYAPALGSHHNLVLHNLFVTVNEDQAVQFIANSDDCEVRNNLIVVATVAGDISGNADGIRMETDDTVTNNVYAGNFYLGGYFEGRDGIEAGEFERSDLDAAWFADFPTGVPSLVADWAPSASAPWLDLVTTNENAPVDILGVERSGMVDVGPFERN